MDYKITRGLASGLAALGLAVTIAGYSPSAKAEERTSLSEIPVVAQTPSGEYKATGLSVADVADIEGRIKGSRFTDAFPQGPLGLFLGHIDVNTSFGRVITQFDFDNNGYISREEGSAFAIAQVVSDADETKRGGPMNTGYRLAAVAQENYIGESLENPIATVSLGDQGEDPLSDLPTIAVVPYGQQAVGEPILPELDGNSNRGLAAKIEEILDRRNGEENRKKNKDIPVTWAEFYLEQLQQHLSSQGGSALGGDGNGTGNGNGNGGVAGPGGGADN